MDVFKKAVGSIKDRIVKSPLERSVLEACSDENWGASNSTLHELAEKTFNHEDRESMMKLIWDLLKSPSKEWRRIYKVLSLIETIIKFGSAACMHDFQDEAFKIRMLQDFSFRENSEEKGTGVRDKSRYLSSLLADRTLLEEEREKAKKTWNKFAGISSDQGYQSNNSWKGDSYDPYVRKDYRTTTEPRPYEDRSSGGDREAEKAANSIFKPVEAKPVKEQKPSSVWEQEPGKLPQAPRIAKPPSSSSNIFEVPVVRPVVENLGRNEGISGGSSYGKYDLRPEPVQFPEASYKSTASTAGSREANIINFPSASLTFPSNNPPSNPVFPGSSSIFSTPGTTVTNNPGYPPASSSFSNNPGYPPAPSSFSNNPQYSSINPTYPSSFPSYPPANPSFSNNPPAFSPQNPIYPSSNPMISQNPPPFYGNNPGYPPPQYSNPQNYSNPSNTIGLPSNIPGYPSNSSNYPGYPPVVPSSNTNNYNQGPVKIHSNISGGSGVTIEQLKVYGNSGFSDFQASPAPVKPPVDIEAKLFSLDDLEAGQPKIKEAVKSRW